MICSSFLARAERAERRSDLLVTMTVVCERCEIRESPFGRIRGLLGRAGLELSCLSLSFR